MPGKLHLRPATADDATFFATRLRSTDLAECRGLIGPTASVEQAILAAIQLSPSVSTACLGTYRPVFVIGCAQGDSDDVGQPWLLATDQVADFPVELTKITKQAIKGWLERWPSLFNYVDERNAASIRWLERLGFAVHAPFVLGVQGEHFRPFTMGA